MPTGGACSARMGRSTSSGTSAFRITWPAPRSGPTTRGDRRPGALRLPRSARRARCAAAAQGAQGRLGGLDLGQLVEDVAEALVAVLELEPAGELREPAGGLLGGGEGGGRPGVLGGDLGKVPAGQLGAGG